MVLVVLLSLLVCLLDHSKATRTLFTYPCRSSRLEQCGRHHLRATRSASWWRRTFSCILGWGALGWPMEQSSGGAVGQVVLFVLFCFGTAECLQQQARGLKVANFQPSLGYISCRFSPRFRETEEAQTRKKTLTKTATALSTQTKAR